MFIDHGKCFCGSPTCKYYDLDNKFCKKCGLHIAGTAPCEDYKEIEVKYMSKPVEQNVSKHSQLTNEQIINSLHIVVEGRVCDNCEIRDCQWGKCHCENIAARAALEVISRLQVQIEALNKEKEELRKIIRSKGE